MKTFSSFLKTIKTKTGHALPGPVRSGIAASFAKGKELGADTPEEKEKYKKMSKRLLKKEPPKFSFSEETKKAKTPWNPDVNVTDWTTPKGVKTATIHNPSNKRELQNFGSTKVPNSPTERYPESKGWLHGDKASFTEPQHPHNQWKEHSVSKGSDDGVPIHVSHKPDGTAHVEISPEIKHTSWHKAPRKDVVDHVQNHPVLNKVYGRKFTVSMHDDDHHIKEQVSDDDIKKFKTHHALNPEHIAGAIEQAHENLKQADTPGEKEFHQKMINNLSGALKNMKSKLH